MPEGAERHLVAFWKFLRRLEGDTRKTSILGIEFEEPDPPQGLGKPHQAPLFMSRLLNILENLLQSGYYFFQTVFAHPRLGTVSQQNPFLLCEAAAIPLQCE